jgi:hypothetical protein
MRDSDEQTDIIYNLLSRLYSENNHLRMFIQKNRLIGDYNQYMHELAKEANTTVEDAE